MLLSVAGFNEGPSAKGNAKNLIGEACGLFSLCPRMELVVRQWPCSLASGVWRLASGGMRAVTESCALELQKTGAELLRFSPNRGRSATC